MPSQWRKRVKGKTGRERNRNGQRQERSGEGKRESGRQWGTKTQIKKLKKKQRERKEKCLSYNEEHIP